LGHLGVEGGREVERFLARTIELHSVSESLDTSTAHGRFVLTLFGGLAQMEREMIVERTRGALAWKRENGLPTSHPPLGFQPNSKRHRMIPVPEEPAIVRRILDLSRAGNSSHAIAAELNEEGVPSKHGAQVSDDGREGGQAAGWYQARLSTA